MFVFVHLCMVNKFMGLNVERSVEKYAQMDIVFSSNTSEMVSSCVCVCDGGYVVNVLCFDATMCSFVGTTLEICGE